MYRREVFIFLLILVWVVELCYLWLMLSVKLRFC